MSLLNAFGITSSPSKRGKIAFGLFLVKPQKIGVRLFALTSKMLLQVNPDLNVSITLTYRGGIAVVVIMASFRVDHVSWSVEALQPRKTIVLNGGNALVLYFDKPSIQQYDLLSVGVQRKFIGPDLTNYLQTAETKFGPVIQPSSNSGALAFAGVAGITAVFLGLFALNAATKGASASEGAPSEEAESTQGSS